MNNSVNIFYLFTRLIYTTKHRKLQSISKIQSLQKSKRNHQNANYDILDKLINKMIIKRLKCSEKDTHQVTYPGTLKAHLSD
jgi:hypothetical protein